jgi:hypothetical protein
MNGDDLIAALENCSLPGEQFHHADHLHAAWIYLKRFPAAEAIGRFSETLRKYAAALGKPDRYHETITWVYLLLVNERIHRGYPQATWNEFALANQDLFDWKNPILRKYYRRETLESVLARTVFVMPETAANSDAG